MGTEESISISENPFILFGESNYQSASVNRDAQRRFSSKDILQWREGIIKFKEWRRNTKKGIISQQQQELVLPLFMGEKPSLFKENVDLSFQQSLEESGFVFEGDYVYRPELVQEIMDTNQDVFKDFQGKTPQAVMKFLSTAPKNEYHLMRGLVLGFPRSSVEDFIKVEDFKMFDVFHNRLPSLLPESEKSLISAIIGGGREAKDITQLEKKIVLEKN